jgi:signal transduction histidine kinase
LIAESWVLQATGIHAGWLVTAVSSSLIMAMPFLLLRLADDFMELPRVVLPVAAGGLLVATVSFFIFTVPYPPVLTIACVLYFVGFMFFVALAFVRAARESRGVTQRRMQAAAAGSICLSLVILLAGVRAAFPAASWWSIGSDLCALGSGLGYFLGFAPPRWIRRAWQVPEVHAFLQSAATLPRLPERQEVVRNLEQGLASAFGVPRASIGLWEPETQVLWYMVSGSALAIPADQMIVGRAFSAQRPLFSADAALDDPAHAAAYRRSRAQAILAAPLTAGDKRLGVLAVFAARTPIFADDDLELVALLAGQAAIVLESHLLIEEATQVRARGEATRLKDDFLAAAAHDLKTPLTAVVAQAQLLERRAMRNPAAPADLAAIGRIVQESQRLKRLVLELLDVARIEQGKLVTQRDQVDLTIMLRGACTRHSGARHRCVVERSEHVIGIFDEQRMMQLLDNLLENAVKYTPAGGEIQVALWRDANMAHIAVTDPGIGIDTADLPQLFERFQRGSNVDVLQLSGLGLGLYICRGIVEQHGGTIEATSPGPGKGSTFHVALPIGTTSATPDELSSVEIRADASIGPRRTLATLTRAADEPGGIAITFADDMSG